MPGSSKKRIRTLRQNGQNDLADWVEAKEKARSENIPLWRWEKENPKPGFDAAKDKIVRTKKKLELVEEAIKSDWEIPKEELAIIEKIRIKKIELKDRARGSTDENELKTLYKVIKKLDIEEKKIIFLYDFQAYDNYMFQDIQDRVDTAEFHFEMIKLYNTSKRALVVCPRGHGKTMTARKYILHQILYKKTGYAILLGASEGMSGQNLRWVRDQLTDNPKIIEIFGWLKDKDKWADTEFRTNTGIKVVAKGAGQKVRGMNEKGRPDLIYIDDLEEDEQVNSKDRRDKLLAWFKEALLPAKSRNGRVIYTGTILHLDSLLKNASENKVKDHIDWDVLWYKAINSHDDGTEYALWEAHKPMVELRALRQIDPQTFAQEYQNSPASGGMAVFKREEYQYIEQKDIVHTKTRTGYITYVKGKVVNLMLNTDMAVSEKEGADYTVLMVTAMDSSFNLYVLEYERFRDSDPYFVIDSMFNMLIRWGMDYTSVEEVAFQTLFKRMFDHEMTIRNYCFYVHQIKRANTRKIFRIKALKAPIRAGKIFWMREHVDLEDELGQVTATRLGTHDDVIDALADGWQIQLELTEQDGEQEAEINTLEWAIQQGHLPTVEEEDEFIQMY